MRRFAFINPNYDCMDSDYSDLKHKWNAVAKRLYLSGQSFAKCLVLCIQQWKCVKVT